jgi:hypothetical protein
MKTSTKTITIEKEIYIAEDGTEFDDRDDCEAYEYRLIGKRLKMYTYGFSPCQSVENCCYARLDTWADVQAFIDLCTYDGISTRGITDPGLYMYSEGRYGFGNEAWVNITGILKNLESEAHE